MHLVAFTITHNSMYVHQFLHSLWRQQFIVSQMVKYLFNKKVNSSNTYPSKIPIVFSVILFTVCHYSCTDIIYIYMFMSYQTEFTGENKKTLWLNLFKRECREIYLQYIAGITINIPITVVQVLRQNNIGDTAPIQCVRRHSLWLLRWHQLVSAPSLAIIIQLSFFYASLFWCDWPPLPTTTAGLYTCQPDRLH